MALDKLKKDQNVTDVTVLVHEFSTSPSLFEIHQRLWIDMSLSVNFDICLFGEKVLQNFD